MFQKILIKLRNEFSHLGHSPVLKMVELLPVTLMHELGYIHRKVAEEIKMLIKWSFALV